MATGDIETIERFLAVESDGKMGASLEAQSKFIAPNCRIEEPGGFPLSGTYVGLDGFFDLARKMVANFAPSATESLLYDAGEFVVWKSIVTWTSTKTGRKITMPVMEAFYVKDSMIVRNDVYYKDPGLFAELMEGHGELLDGSSMGATV